jgi:hypothetical protein
MRSLRVLPLLAVLALQAGCMCSMKIDPALQAEVDGYFATPRTARVFEGSGTYRQVPWKVGQWVVYHNEFTDSPNTLVWIKYSIVGEEAPGQFWLQYEYVNYYQRGLMMYLVTKIAPGHTENMEISRIVRYDPRRGGSFEQPPGTFNTKPGAEGFNAFEQTGESVEDLTALAGTFRKAMKITGRYKMEGAGTFSMWFHDAVPIHGFVKNVQSGSSFVTELWDFGMTGAERKITDWKPEPTVHVGF